MKVQFFAAALCCAGWMGTAQAGEGLSDLSKATFTCPKTGLNAAARAAAQVPTQGMYQFSYFKLVTDGSFSKYEVQFTSNYLEEKVLKYEVSVYCQQGIDPEANVSVKLLP